MDFLDLLIIVIVLGGIVLVGIGIVLYYTFFESKDSIRLINLSKFQNALMQFENQLHHQANYYDLDSNFNSIFRLIQQSTQDAKGETIKINQTVTSEISNQYSEIMKKFQESESIRNMKHEMFTTNLSSLAANAGIDISSLSL